MGLVAADPPDDYDVALLGDRTDDGEGVRTLRLQPGRATLGELRPMKEGKPIHGDVVSLKPREDQPGAYDVDVKVAAPAPAPKSGPAQVATAAYRSSWTRIFERPGTGESN
jgi:hypothetical protein